MPAKERTSSPLPLVWGTGNLVFESWFYDPDEEEYGYRVLATPGPASHNTPDLRNIKTWVESQFPTDGFNNEHMFETGVMAYGYTPDDDSLKEWDIARGNPVDCDGICEEEDFAMALSDPEYRYYRASTPAAPHNHFTDWHSLYLKYLDKMSWDRSRDDSYHEFMKDQYSGARRLLVQMEGYEYVAKVMTAVLACHILDILSSDSDGLESSLRGATEDALKDSIFDEIRKDNLLFGTSTVPHVSPIEVQQYTYPDFRSIGQDSFLAYISAYGQKTLGMNMSDANAEVWANHYLQRPGYSGPSQAWLQRSQNASAISKAVQFLMGSSLMDIINLLTDEADSLL